MKQLQTEMVSIEVELQSSAMLLNTKPIASASQFFT
jgi:hypothetical protein